MDRTTERNVDGELLTRRQTSRLTGLSPRTISRLRKRTGTFPQPVQLPGLRDPRYRKADVLAWLASLESVGADPEPAWSG